MSSPNWWGDWRPTLTPHTGNLLATDLIECTMIVGGLPVNTVITGAQILGAVPTPSVAWGSITGTLSAQTDLNTALSGKASTGAVTGTGITMSTATILGRSTAGTGAIEEITIGSGLTLSAGTLTASGGGLTVGTTAIVSGTIGRVLFQGTGNVLQQSANLFWDNTNNRLGIGTSSPIAFIHSEGSVTASSGIARGNYLNNTLVAAANNNLLIALDIQPTFTNSGFSGVSNIGIRVNGEFLVSNGKAFTTTSGAAANTGGFSSGQFFATGTNLSSGNVTLQTFYAGVGYSTPFLINPSGGNVIIGSSTNAGYKLDVNGTARVQGKLSVNTPSAASAVMEVTSTTQGFLPPRMTTAQKNAIASPAAGLVVYDTTLNKLCVRTASAWETITSL